MNSMLTSSAFRKPRCRKVKLTFTPRIKNYEYYSYAEKKGYSGTAIFAKKEPLSVAYGIDGKHNDEVV